MSTDTNDTVEADGARGDDEFVPFLGRFFPESLALAALLSILALVVTIPSLDAITQAEHFSTGFFELFELQMALVLLWVLSASVVESRPFGVLFDRIASQIPTSQTAIIYSTGFIALVFGWVNWALGLVGGIFIGQQLCRRAREEGVRVHYPLVLVGGLLSLVITNQGLSSPGALLMADETGTTNFLVDAAGSIDMLGFVGDPVNLVPTVVLVVTLPLLLVVLAPDDESERIELGDHETVLDGSIAETLDYYTPPSDDFTVADRLEQSKTISIVAVILGVISIGAHFGFGGPLTMLWFLFTLMMLGLLVQVRPMAFRSKTTHATRWANHIAIPFLLYAAVYVLLREGGLYEPIGGVITAIGAGAGGFVSALVVGLLVPDPGSTWVILGPALAAVEADLIRSITAVMFGAGLSNLWLGFLFAGILSIRGFEWREFVRYAAAITAYVVVVVLVAAIVF